MKIKSDIEFESFSDGVCDIYTQSKDGNKVNKYMGLGFSNRALGYNRVFAAAAVNVNLNAVIRIPMVKGIDNNDIVEIERNKYTIELGQNKYETNPPSIDLTLRLIKKAGAL